MMYCLWLVMTTMCCSLGLLAATSANSVAQSTQAPTQRTGTQRQWQNVIQPQTSDPMSQIAHTPVAANVSTKHTAPEPS